MTTVLAHVFNTVIYNDAPGLVDMVVMAVELAILQYLLVFIFHKRLPGRTLSAFLSPFSLQLTRRQTVYILFSLKSPPKFQYFLITAIARKPTNLDKNKLDKVNVLLKFCFLLVPNDFLKDTGSIQLFLSYLTIVKTCAQANAMLKGYSAIYHFFL